MKRMQLLLGAVLLLLLTQASQTLGKTEVRQYNGQLQEDGEMYQPLRTSDGVLLHITYYTSEKGIQAVPVILLHDFGGNRNDMASLAQELQAAGHAVIVPDLRGHGASTRRVNGDVLDPDRFNARDYQAMVLNDMETIKQFVWDENNLRRLNAENLAIIGAGDGASVGLYWAKLNWSRPQIGTARQGQDVKALGAISPDLQTVGLPLLAALSGTAPRMRIMDSALLKVLKRKKDPRTDEWIEPPLGQEAIFDFRKEIAVMIAVGQGDRIATRKASQLNNLLKRYHLEDDDYPKDLFYGELRTSLQGSDMLGQEIMLERAILRFVDKMIVARGYPHSERKGNPYSN